MEDRDTQELTRTTCSDQMVILCNGDTLPMDRQYSTYLMSGSEAITPIQTEIRFTISSCWFASTFGRTDNVKFWLKRFPEWDIERKNKVVGGTPLGSAVYMGPKRLALVKVLLEHGASTGFKNFSGASILTSLCSSEDCDPEVVELVLKPVLG